LARPKVSAYPPLIKLTSGHSSIKVLHPDIAFNFSRDLNVLKSVVALASYLFPSLEWLSLKESIDEFAALMEIQVIFSRIQSYDRELQLFTTPRVA
jgi:hypothetical protein